MLRFSYSAATRTYTLDSGFPVTLSTNGGMEAVGIEKDTTGKLWVTYTKNQSVYITHSTTSDSTWAISPAEAVSKLAPWSARRDRTSCAGLAFTA